MYLSQSVVMTNDTLISYSYISLHTYSIYISYNHSHINIYMSMVITYKYSQNELDPFVILY